MPILATLHQDGAIEVETPWQVGLVWEPASHYVLQEMLPVQAGMFPLPVRQTTYVGLEAANVVEWRYDVKYSRKERSRVERSISAVERVLMVGRTFFQIYELFSNPNFLLSDTFFNSFLFVNA